MSLFNCIPNGCARVVWQPYEKASGIRYRYPGEDWVYVDGDDWSTENGLPQDYGYHRLYFDFTSRVGEGGTYYGWACGDTGTIRSDWFQGRILAYRYNSGNNQFRLLVDYETEAGQIVENHFVNTVILASGGGSAFSGTIFIRDDCSGLPTVMQIGDITNDRAEDVSGTIHQGCTFKVFKEGEIVHEETRDECPEVELTEDSCQLSETHHEIVIEKTPWISAIDVIDYGRDSDKVSGVPYPVPTVFAIPENCLNIYRFEILDVLPDGDPNDPEPIFNDYITQICSADGCPRPKYTVYCDCDCESCPDGTCAVICDDHICCNDSSSGKNITSIPIDNYCEI